MYRMADPLQDPAKVPEVEPHLVKVKIFGHSSAKEKRSMEQPLEHGEVFLTQPDIVPGGTEDFKWRIFTAGGSAACVIDDGFLAADIAIAKETGANAQIHVFQISEEAWVEKAGFLQKFPAIYAGAAAVGEDIPAGASARWKSLIPAEGIAEKVVEIPGSVCPHGERARENQSSCGEDTRIRLDGSH